MTTGLVGVLGISTSLTYTPQSNAKVTVVGFNWTLNGIGVSGSTNGVSASFYASAGQPLTFSTSSGGAALISAIEENT